MTELPRRADPTVSSSTAPSLAFRIAVDIGGTFTDCVVLDERGQRLTTKALTTPEDPADGVVRCVELAAEQLGTDVRGVLGRTVAFVHGTTIGTNTLVQRRGARTGLLMTRGHEQTITIGRVRQKVMGLSTQKMEELVRNVTEKELKLIVDLGYVLGAIVGAVSWGISLLF